MPQRILIHQYFILKLRLNTDSDPQNTNRDPIIRVIAIQQITVIKIKRLVDHYKVSTIELDARELVSITK